MEKSSDLIENQTRDLLACSIVPQPSTLPRAPIALDLYLKLTEMETNEVDLFKVSKNEFGKYT
jgi:hypothetical protein